MENKIEIKSTIPYKEAENCAKEIADLMIHKTLGGQMTIDFRRPLFEHYCFAKYFTNMDLTPYPTPDNWDEVYDVLTAHDIEPRGYASWYLVQDLLSNILVEEERKHNEEISIEMNAAKLLRKIEKNITSPLKRDMTEMIIDRLLKEEA